MKPRLAEIIHPKNRINYSDLARAYGCTRGFVSNIANGRIVAPDRFKKMCAEKLGLPVEVLFPVEDGR